jgi:CRISPR/Cas system CSM-associated protein Csm4 (group 5 of RAMP superfamily)
MELTTSDSFDFDIGRRIFIIISFLVALWYGLNLLVNRIKSKQIKIPKFLLNKIPALENIAISESSDLYQIEIIQRKTLADGSEFLILDVNGRHLLVSKHIQSGINYIADLNDIQKLQ